jgi:hypothetical protein
MRGKMYGLNPKAAAFILHAYLSQETKDDWKILEEFVCNQAHRMSMTASATASVTAAVKLEMMGFEQKMALILVDVGLKLFQNEEELTWWLNHDLVQTTCALLLRQFPEIDPSLRSVAP